MKNIIGFILCVSLIFVFLTSCYYMPLGKEKLNEEQTNENDKEIQKRYLFYPFENVSEFDNFYIVSQNYMNSCSQELSAEQVFSGNYSHKAWIYNANEPSTLFKNNNHRAYPTIQFYKIENGAIKTPCLITIYIWLDIELHKREKENEWISFATLSTDKSDNWTRTICINLDYNNIVHLMHVPYQGKKQWVYQTADITFPMKEWVKITIYLDTTPEKGFVKVYQNDELVSHGLIADGNGNLEQAHFGLYAAPSITHGIIFNDNLEIKEI